MLDKDLLNLKQHRRSAINTYPEDGVVVEVGMRFESSSSQDVSHCISYRFPMNQLQLNTIDPSHGP